MIIEKMTDMFLTFLRALNPLHLPSLPAEIVEYIDMAFDYVEAGGGILANYINLDYALTLLTLLVVADLVIWGYHMIMWVLRKIPILNIK